MSGNPGLDRRKTSRTMIEQSDSALKMNDGGGSAEVGDSESFMTEARNSSIINHNHFER